MTIPMELVDASSNTDVRKYLLALREVSEELRGELVTQMGNTDKLLSLGAALDTVWAVERLLIGDPEFLEKLTRKLVGRDSVGGPFAPIIHSERNK